MDINSDRVECVHFTSKRIVKKAEADNNTFSLTTALIVKLLSHYRCRSTFYSDAYAFTYIHIAHATHLLGDAPPGKIRFAGNLMLGADGKKSHRARVSEHII